MDAARVFLGRKKQWQRPGQGQPGVRHPDNYFARGLERPGHDNGGRVALFGESEERGVLGKSELTRPRVFSWGQPGEVSRTVADDLTLEVPGDFGNGDRNRRGADRCEG